MANNRLTNQQVRFFGAGLIVSSITAITAGILWALDYPMFSDEMWLWISFFGVVGTAIFVAFLAIRGLFSAYPVDET